MNKEKHKEQANCTSYQELVWLGQKRGYANPEFWARRIWDARKNKSVEATPKPC